MESLTQEEFSKLQADICPDCGSKKPFLGGPKGPGVENILCSDCKMQFNIGLCDGERLGLYVEPTISDPLYIPEEGHIVLKNDGSFEYLIHSCSGSVDFHHIGNGYSCLLCRKCMMRFKFPDGELDKTKVSSYKLSFLFRFLKSRINL